MQDLLDAVARPASDEQAMWVSGHETNRPPSFNTQNAPKATGFESTRAIRAQAVADWNRMQQQELAKLPAGARQRFGAAAHGGPSGGVASAGAAAAGAGR